MKYKIITDKKEANGCGYQGTIKLTYLELVQMFGKPLEGSIDGKTQAEWIVIAAGSVVITIYDYKEDYTKPRDVLLWHVGGKTKDALQILNIIVKEWKKANK